MAADLTGTVAPFQRNRLKARATARACDVLSILYAALMVVLLVLVLATYARSRGFSTTEVLFSAMPITLAGVLGYGVLRGLGSAVTLLADLSERTATASSQDRHEGDGHHGET